jgi:hypothetical protein
VAAYSTVDFEWMDDWYQYIPFIAQLHKKELVAAEYYQS